MTIEINVQQARDSFAELCDAAANGETVIIRRPGAEDVALVPAAEVRSLEETAILLRSPENAERLLRAMFRALAESRTGAEHPSAILQT